MPRLVFNDEVGERYHDLDGKHDSNQRRPSAVPFIPGEGKEKIRVQKLSRGMQREFAGRPSLVRKAFRDFVMPEVVESPEEPLNHNQCEQKGHDRAPAAMKRPV